MRALAALVLISTLTLPRPGLAQDDESSVRDAIKHHLEEEELAQAATLAYRLRESSDDESKALAEQVLRDTASKLVRVTIHCVDCSVLVEDVQQLGDTFFIEADDSQDLVAQFPTGRTERSVEGSAGQHLHLYLEPPEAPPGDPGAATAPGASSSRSAGGRGSAGGIPPIMLFVSAGVTAVAAGATIWSAIDMNGDVDAYEAALDRAEQNRSIEDLNEAERLLRRGDDKELRTELLLGVTAGLAVVSGLLVLVVDWHGDSEHARTTLPSLAIERDGARVSIGGPL